MSHAITAKPITMLFSWVIRVGSRNYVLDSDSPRGRGTLVGLSGSLKSIMRHCCCVCCNKLETWQLQWTALLLTDWCHINFSPVRNPPPPSAIQPFVKILFTTCYCCVAGEERTHPTYGFSIQPARDRQIAWVQVVCSACFRIYFIFIDSSYAYC